LRFCPAKRFDMGFDDPYPAEAKKAFAPRMLK